MTKAMIGSINFFLQWEEYFAAQELFRRSRGGLLPEWIAGGLLILLGVVLAIVGGLSIFAADILLLCPFLIGMAIIFGSPFIRRWASKRKWQREPLYHTEHEVAFSDDGVYFRMGKIESNLNWKYYQRIMEIPEGLLLIYSNESFNLLPKRAFADEGLMRDFRLLAQKKLK